MTKLPQPKYAIGSLGAKRAVDYTAFWARGTATPDQVTQPPVAIYEAQHCSLYYRMAAPLFTAAGGVADLRLSVAVLRLANVLFLAGALWLALGAVGRICPDRWDAALLGLLIALHPYFLLNGARVANDALGVLLGTAVVVCCLSFVGRRLWLASVLLGTLLGLAVLAKACNLALLPLAALWGPALVIRRKAPLRARAGGGLVVGAGLRGRGRPLLLLQPDPFRRADAHGRSHLQSASRPGVSRPGVRGDCRSLAGTSSADLAEQ